MFRPACKHGPVSPELTVWSVFTRTSHVVSSDERPDGELVVRSATGDDAAFAVLVRRHIRAATLLAAQLTGDRDEAEDIVQSAFAIVHRRLSEFDRARPFAAWLFGIVRHIAERNRARAARRKRLWGLWGTRIGDGLHAPAPDILLAARRELEAVYVAMRGLPPMQRACFELVAIRDVAPADAAAMHGITESTVRQHVFRARRAIRAALGEDA